MLDTIPNNLVEVIGGLADAGGLAVLISFVGEWVPSYQKLTPKVKFFTILGVSLLLPIAARLTIDLVPSATWGLLEPYWQSLARGALIFGGTQIAHLWRKNGKGA